MITNLEFLVGKKIFDCSLKRRIGDNALIVIRGENGLPIKLKVKFDLIKVSKKNIILDK